jgi:Uma2 family endonuclease
MAIAGAEHVPHAWQRRLRVDEYHRMVEAGVFDEDERLELLDGVLVAMSPQGTRHAHAICFLNEALTRALGPGYTLRPQLPLTLGDDAEPEPDLAVVDRRESRPDRHPTRALIVIEVASDSLAKDRSVKRALYARFAVQQYVIVNLVDDCVEIYREPSPAEGRYLTAATFGRGESFELSELGLTLAVHDVIGPAET